MVDNVNGSSVDAGSAPCCMLLSVHAHTTHAQPVAGGEDDLKAINVVFYVAAANDGGTSIGEMYYAGPTTHIRRGAGSDGARKCRA